MNINGGTWFDVMSVHVRGFETWTHRGVLSSHIYNVSIHMLPSLLQARMRRLMKEMEQAKNLHVHEEATEAESRDN